MARRTVANYRGGRRTRGASVPPPAPDRRHWLASLGRVVLMLFGIGVTVVVFAGLKEALIRVNTQRVSTVQIEGTLNFADRASLEATVNSFVADSMVALDLEALKHELESDPWINDAEIKRQWPDILNITLVEEVAIARWGDGQLVSQQGELFAPAEIVDQMQLPHLSGPAGSAHEVMLQYRQFNQLLYPLGVRIRDLALNGRNAWTMTVAGTGPDQMQNSVRVRVGRDDVLARMRRLVAWLESGESVRLAQVSSIDLRYANGLAVAFQDGQEAGGQAIVAQGQ